MICASAQQCCGHSAAAAAVVPARRLAGGRPSRPPPAARAAAGHCSAFKQRSRLQRVQVVAEAGAAAGAAEAPAVLPVSKLNTIPHDRTIRQHFYKECAGAIKKAVNAGEMRLIARCTIPELNTDFDVYRVGTLLELVREVATSLAADGKTVKVSVQQALGQGVFQGMPLSLNGVSRIMNQMDWGESKDRIKLGNLGAAEVEGADAFVLIAPQNIVGHSVMPLLEGTSAEMSEAAGAAGKPMVLINPKLTDIQSAGGVMSIRGRQDRLDFAATFATAYHFRLLYKGVTMYPIMGALRHVYGQPWEVFIRAELGGGEEEYRHIAAFEQEPKPPQITEAFRTAWAKMTA